MDEPAFDRLPLEVRELIYQQFFASISHDRQNEKRSIIELKSSKTNHKSSLRAQYTWSACNVSNTTRTASALSLLLLNKQIYAEATRVYWRHRTLHFKLDNSVGPFNEVYHTPERIAAICCVRDYLLNLATRKPIAISGLANVTIRIPAFDTLDLAEMFDIIDQTRKLLRNWRTSNTTLLPFWFNFTGLCEMRLRNDRPVSASVQQPQDSLRIDFDLPIHDSGLWKLEVHRRIKTARLQLHKIQHEFDEGWCNWDLDLLEWSMVNFQGDIQSCARQSGCHCERHIGRTQMARELELSKLDRGGASTAGSKLVVRPPPAQKGTKTTVALLPHNSS